MPLDSLKDFLPLFALYPEIHYRFKAFPFSRYFRRQPEMLADAPSRLQPGEALPVLLLIKDADSFPAALHEVKIEAQTREVRHSHVVKFGGERVDRHWWHHISWVELPDESPSDWEVSVTWQVEIAGRGFTFKNDNIPGLSHAPLSVYQSATALPQKEGWHFGDLHVHTSYTEDQVEFGAPLNVYPQLGKAVGLSFTLAADHGYDLDDLPASYLENDPVLLRFGERNAEIGHLNEAHRGDFCILPGYELSVGNGRDRNVHLLAINQQDFLSGSGDSAERWFHNRPELSIDEALAALGDEALAVAAHPLMKPPLFERWLLRRGSWERSDLEHRKLAGLQVWNGGCGRDFQRGLAEWKRGLLEGKHWRIFAGSDAHGNFNRYRQIRTPMLFMQESPGHIFGEARTGVSIDGDLTVQNVLKALRSGRSLVTNGPFVELQVSPQSGGTKEIAIEALSTPEYGALSEVILWWGRRGLREEEEILRESPRDAQKFSVKLKLDKPDGYLRGEIRTDAEKAAYTNPIFLSE